VNASRAGAASRVVREFAVDGRLWRVAKRAARSSARRARTRGNAAKNHRASSARIGARSENFRYRVEFAAKKFLCGKSIKPAAVTDGGAALAEIRGKDSQGMIFKDSAA
jgi:hypothetical protein